LHQNQLDTEAVIRSGVLRVTQFEELKLKPGNLKLNMGIVRQSSSRSGGSALSKVQSGSDDQGAAGHRPQTGMPQQYIVEEEAEEEESSTSPKSPGVGQFDSQDEASKKSQPSPMRAILAERGLSDMPLAPSLRKRILAERALNPETASMEKTVAISPSGRSGHGSALNSPTLGSPLGTTGRNYAGGLKSPSAAIGAKSPTGARSPGARSPIIRSPVSGSPRVASREMLKESLEDEYGDPSPQRVSL